MKESFYGEVAQFTLVGYERIYIEQYPKAQQMFIGCNDFDDLIELILHAKMKQKENTKFVTMIEAKLKAAVDEIRKEKK